MIKYVIFDNGGVLVKDDWLDFLNNLKQISPTVAEEVVAIEHKATVGEVGLEDFIEYLDPIIKKYRLNYDPLKANNICTDVLKIVDILPKRIRTGMLTNEFSTFDIYDQNWHFRKLFKGLIFTSSKIGLRKPDPEIYKYMLKELDCLPEEVIFVDDRSQNVKAATKLGINGIMFKDAGQLKKELFKLLENDEK